MYLMRLQATGAADADRVADLLLSLPDPDTGAAAALEIEGKWRIDAYYIERPDEAARAHILSLIETPEGFERNLQVMQIADRDWVKSSLDGLPPVSAGRFIVHGRHDRHRVGANQIGIEIEAGLAFGTGHHATTKGCLIAIDDVIKRRAPRIALDVGTGTGVLAIALARAGHVPVLATDIDADSVVVARENVRANAAAANIHVIRADGVAAPDIADHAPYDLVVANILANPLAAMATGMARVTVPGSAIILSGLLSWQGRQVIAAYRNRGFALVRRFPVDGWLTLLMQRL